VQGLCPFDFCEDPLGDVVGKGSLLVFDTWKRPQAHCAQPCVGPKQDGRLFRIDGNKAVQIAASSGELTPLAVDDGHILVDEGSGQLAILDSAGTELSRISVPGLSEATMQGSDLVVHVGATLDDYNAANGVLLHAWPMPAGAILEDVQGGTAVYVTSADVHLLRLDDGHDAAITPPGSGPLHAQLEPGGLFYSYTAANPERPGRVAFVPTGSLP
jgi:hypothetical protein